MARHVGAFVTGQPGDGVLANVALDRTKTDDTTRTSLRAAHVQQ